MNEEVFSVLQIIFLPLSLSWGGGGEGGGKGVGFNYSSSKELPLEWVRVRRWVRSVKGGKGPHVSLGERQ